VPIYLTLGYVYLPIFRNALTKPQNHADKYKKQTTFIKVHNAEFKTPPYEKNSHTKLTKLHVEAGWGSRQTHFLS
jgi:hypothetical protein